MPRQRIDPNAITAIALSVVDEEGYDALSLSSVAEQLGVGPSALYSHVDGVDGLRRLVALHAMQNLVDQVREAAIGVSGAAAVRGVGDAYRGFARRHPGQFHSTVASAECAAILEAAHDELVSVFALVFRGAGLDAAASSRAARSARTAVHGFVTLELTAGPSAASDAHFRELLDWIADRA